MRRAILTVCVAAVLVALAGRGTLAAFTSQADNPDSAVTAAADFKAPTISAVAIGKSSGGATGFLGQAGTYFVYASVSDTGNPASGVALVTVDVANVSTGLTTVPMVSGSYSAGGASFNYRSAPLIANLTLSEGSRSFTVSGTDNASNSGSQSGNVTVDNTAPTGSDVQTANGGSTAGKPEQSDSVTYTFSEPVDPESILAGWDGSSTSVVVRLRNGGLLGLLGNKDDLEIWGPADTFKLPLGTLDLGRTDYVGGVLGGEVLRFGATGTPSTMSMSGNNITVSFGTASGSATASTAAGSGTMSWSPSAGATDRAGNGASTSAASESGAADKEF